MEKAKVAVFIGSASDEATVAPCADILKKLGGDEADEAL